MADLGNTKIYGDLSVAGNTTNNGDFIIGNATTQNKLVLNNAPLDSNLASRIEFRTTDGQYVQLRHNTHDTVKAPFGLHIEKTADNTNSTHNAYLSVEGEIVAGDRIVAPSFTGSLSGTATSAANLANINTTFSGTYPLTVNVNGTIYSHGNITYNGTTQTLSTSVFDGSLSGNATTATTLATARTINGTSFNGSTNITTANWGTARTITIGSTGKSVNGSGNVAWSLAEIGAAAASHTHGYLPLAGGTVTGDMTVNTTLSVRGAIDLADSDYLRFGSSDDFQIWYNGSTNYGNIELEAASLGLLITDNGTTRFTFAKSTGAFTASGDITAYSDRRLKSDIKPLETAIDKLMKLNPVQYVKDDEDSIGFIAQELKEVYPEFVRGEETEDTYLSVNYSQMVATLTKGFQEQQEIIDKQQILLNNLQEQINKLNL